MAQSVVHSVLNNNLLNEFSHISGCDVLTLPHSIDEELRFKEAKSPVQGPTVGAEAEFTPRQGNSRACALNDLTICLSHRFIQLKYIECLLGAKLRSRWWR